MDQLVNVLGQVETQMDRINYEVLGNEDCSRYFRMEVRTPDGKKRFYSLKAGSKGAARVEASELVYEMVESFKDERIMWRMVGDRNWRFGATFDSKPRKSIMNRFINFFFDLED